MTLFNKQGKTLIPLKEVGFRLEKEIQTLTENNLPVIFGYKFVKSEFTIGSFRIDTLAYDEESSCFVIIEYKKNKNFSVIDQGYAYLSLMLNNKADFVLEYNENNDDSLRKKDIDWSQSKVLFISPGYTVYQKESINFKDLPIELWTIRKFSNGNFLYNKVHASNAQESVKTISRKSKEAEMVDKEVKVYTETEHLEKSNEGIKELYDKFRSMIMNLDQMEIKPKKLYIAFVSGCNVIDIHPQKRGLKCWLNLKKGQLDDPKGIARDVSSVGHWGNGDYEFQISDDENLEYILSLVKQSWKINKI